METMNQKNGILPDLLKPNCNLIIYDIAAGLQSLPDSPSQSSMFNLVYCNIEIGKRITKRLGDGKCCGAPLVAQNIGFSV